MLTSLFEKNTILPSLLEQERWCNMAFKVKWLGQGGFELSDGETTIMIDPYLSDMVERVDGVKRMVPSPVQPIDAHPDLYVITHDHMDHLDEDTLTVMNKEGILFAAPSSCHTKLIELCIEKKNILSFNRGDKMTFKGFELSAVYAKHTADSIGVILKKDGITAYFTGDSELTDEVGNGVVCDVLFTCINGRWGNMGIDDALLLSDRVQAKVGIPNHYGLFAENTADPTPFIEGLEKQNKVGYIMTIGKEFELADL